MPTLVVEDGTGIANANAYINVAYADSYHALYENAGWTDTKASATLSMPVNVTAGDRVTIDGIEYTFTTVEAAYTVLVGATAQESQANLVAAINRTGNIGVQYGVGTLKNADVVASDPSSDVITLTATVAGVGGNGTSLTESFTSKFNYFSSDAMAGGEDKKTGAIVRATRWLDRKYGQRWNGSQSTKAQALDFPREGIITRDGYEVDSNSLPEDLKKACAEAALVCLNDDPMADVQPSASVGITAESVSVGPISLSSTYGGALSTQVQYQKVEAYLDDLAVSASEVRRS